MTIEKNKDGRYCRLSIEGKNEKREPVNILKILIAKGIITEEDIAAYG